MLKFKNKNICMYIYTLMNYVMKIKKLICFYFLLFNYTSLPFKLLFIKKLFFIFVLLCEMSLFSSIFEIDLCSKCFVISSKFDMLILDSSLFIKILSDDKKTIPSFFI